MNDIPSGVALIEARLALIDLNTDFCHYLDHGDIEALAMLFTEDAYYAHGSRVSRGRGEIHALFQGRASGVRTARHLYSGLKINFDADDAARGSSTCMTFAANAEPPIIPATPYLVADFHDLYQRCEDGRWRIASRVIERIFLDESNSGPVGAAPQD